MNKSFKSKLTKGEILIGSLITIPSTEIAEIFYLSGLDWLFVDLEHSTLGIKDAQLILQTVTPNLPCLIRVPSNDLAWIKRALDIGASGIIAPQVQTAEDAKRIVRFCKYPLDGSRSVGIARAQGYGSKFQEYVNFANEEVAVVLQIEDIHAVENIEDILSVSGIDCIFIGQYDLSASMGKMGMVNDFSVQETIAYVKKCAEQRGIPLGVFGLNVDNVRPYIKSGYTLIAVGVDTVFLANGISKMIKLLK
jgi:2-dehydro-3-deoxyglucarate aldolase